MDAAQFAEFLMQAEGIAVGISLGMIIVFGLGVVSGYSANELVQMIAVLRRRRKKIDAETRT